MIKIYKLQIKETLLNGVNTNTPNYQEEEQIIREEFSNYADWCTQQLIKLGHTVHLYPENGFGCFVPESTEEEYDCQDLTEFWDWYSPTKGTTDAQ